MITADDFRVTGEMAALYFSVAFAFFVALVLTGATFGLILLVIAYSLISIKIEQGRIVGTAVRVSPSQFPEIHSVAVTSAKRLSMDLPEVYVSQDKDLNAFAIGAGRQKMVVLHSALVEAMNADELASIIGHEFSHIKCGHTRWILFTNMGNLHAPVISLFTNLIFKGWSRKAEQTCDRGGLIAAGDLGASISALGKLAVGGDLFNKMDVNEFLKQETQSSSLVTEMLSAHPFISQRIRYLISYAKTGGYQQLAGLTDGKTAFTGEDGIMKNSLETGGNANSPVGESGEEIHYAPRSRRIIAGLIDLLIAYAIIFAIDLRLAAAGVLMKRVMIVALLLPLLYLLLKDSFGGQSAGKMMMGITVYNEKEKNPSGIMDSIIRNWYLAIPVLGQTLFPLIIGIQVLLGKRQRIGDKDANTIVITTP
jgi:Zn-dependent protease with chaperone function/uncharacterized RDD family membrane protein YckC